MPDYIPPVADDVIVRARTGDEHAYKTIVLHYATDLIRFALIISGDIAEAEDIVQDVFVQVWKRRAILPGANKLPGYLYRATRNRAIDALRHQRTVQAYRLKMMTAPAFNEEPDEQDAVLEELAHAYTALTDRQRLALMLRYEQGHTHAEVAHILGITLRAAEQLTKRALIILRNQLRP